MFKDGCVSLTSPDIIIATRQLYSAAETVTRLLGQLKIDAGLVSQALCIDDIYIDDIRSGWLLSDF